LQFYVIWEKHDQILAKKFCILKNMHSRAPTLPVDSIYATNIFKAFWGTKKLSQIFPTVCQNAVDRCFATNTKIH